MSTFEIVMLGNTGVGKTSMLAALSKEIRDINNVCGVSFSPCGETTTELDDAWNDLVQQIESGGLYKPVVKALAGTKDYVPYNFNICLNGEAKAQVDFVDTKGGFIRDVDGSGLLERTANAHGVFCVIDASVLMECDESTNNRFNRPGLIADLFGKIFARERHPKFVVFVLTKCETYMLSGEQIRKMKEKFHGVYSESIRLLQCKRINSYAMAIQTLGCVRFNSLVDTVDDKGKVLKLPQFVKVLGRPISSLDCEIPLVVTMKNILWMIRNSRAGILDWLMDLLGMGDDLNAYISQLENIKKLGGEKGCCYYEELASDY